MNLDILTVNKYCKSSTEIILLSFIFLLFYYYVRCFFILFQNVLLLLLQHYFAVIKLVIRQTKHHSQRCLLTCHHTYTQAKNFNEHFNNLFFFFKLSKQQISQFNSDPHYNAMKNVLSYTKKSLTADRNGKTKESKHKPTAISSA